MVSGPQWPVIVRSERLRCRRQVRAVPAETFPAATYFGGIVMSFKSGTRSGVRRSGLLLLLVAGLVGGCAAPPPGHRIGGDEPLPQVARRQATDLVIYPLRGQSQGQQRRDRYECHQWAAAQSGFDPATMSQTPTEVPRVEPSPPGGTGVVQGTVTGAVLGAVVSGPRHRGEGAAVGAVVGAIAGAASDSARQAQAERVQDAYARRAAARDQVYTEKESRYRRAIEACLDGRGYQVR